MPLDVSTDDQLLVRVLRDPQALRLLSPGEFGRVIDAAAGVRLLGWLWQRVEQGLVPAQSPQWFEDRLVTLRAMVDEYDRAVLWEVDRLRRALGPTGIRWMLLKGAAYLAAGLPP